MYFGTSKKLSCILLFLEPINEKNISEQIWFIRHLNRTKFIEDLICTVDILVDSWKGSKNYKKVWNTLKWPKENWPSSAFFISSSIGAALVSLYRPIERLAGRSFSGHLPPLICSPGLSQPGSEMPVNVYDNNKLIQDWGWGILLMIFGRKMRWRCLCNIGSSAGARL